MKNLFLLIITAAAFASLGGCANLETQVDILDRQFFQTATFKNVQTLADAESARALITPGKDGQAPLDVEQAKVAQNIKAADAVLARLALVNPEAAKQIKDYLPVIARQIDDRFNAARKEYRLAVESIRTAPESTDLSSAQTHLSSGQQYMIDAQRIVKQELDFSTLSSWFDSNSATKPSNKTTEASDIQTSTAKSFDAIQTDTARSIGSGIVGERGLFDDQYASAVVYAPPQFWHQKDKPQSLIPFNQAHGFGGWGNTDVAIRMDGTADFSVKGVRVDAEQVTKATFAGINQAIRLAAAASGVPIAGKTPSVTKTDDATAGPTADAGADLRAAQARLRANAAAAARQSATVAILSAIANEQAAFTSPGNAAVNDDQKAAITRIRSLYATYRDALSTAPSSSATAAPAADTTPGS